jgi:hypothetical protein
MSVSPSDVIGGINFIRDVVSKASVSSANPFHSSTSFQVKDNQEELQRVSDRLQHILNVLEENKSRDIIRQEEYNDALVAISE